MTDQKILPPPKPRRRSSLKRQRMAVVIGLAAVAVLAVAFALVWYFTTRVTFHDLDGTKYYAVKKGSEFVLQDTNGEPCVTNSAGNYLTVANTEVFVDDANGACKIVSIVLGEGEVKKFDAYSDTYKILMYPQMERFGATDDLCIQSIEVHNEKDTFTFVLNKKGEYEIKGNPGTLYDQNKLASLAVSTGYTTVQYRLEIAKANEKNSDGSWKYPEYEGFRQNGYAEYGLPEKDEDATTYYILKSKSGITHKVIVGDMMPAGTGYYVRYAGRPEVYVMAEGTASEYAYPVSDTLFSTLEDYVTPLAVVEMSLNNYFDITNFNLSTVSGLVPGTDKVETAIVVGFSYIPIELRQGTFYAHAPYIGEDFMSGFTINSYRVDDCLQNLQMMAPLRTVYLDNQTDNAMDETIFAKEYGVAFVLTFTFNAERGGESSGYAPVSDQQYTQAIWISPKTDDETYFVYNEIFDMVVEVSAGYFEFLEWTSFQWIEADIFSGNIGFLEKVEFESVTGTTAGLTGIKDIDFILDNSASSDKLTASGNVDTSGLKVYANYGTELGQQIEVTQFRNLYTTLLYSSLEGMANCSEAEQEAFRASGDAGAYLVLRLTYNVDGVSTTRTYRFYAYGGGRNTFVTINGNGEFCMLTKRVNKIVSDFGRILAGETIDPRVMDGV